MYRQVAEADRPAEETVIEAIKKSLSPDQNPAADALLSVSLLLVCRSQQKLKVLNWADDPVNVLVGRLPFQQGKRR